MQRKDYVALILFVTALSASAVLASLGLAGQSVGLLALTCILGWAYFTSRNRGWRRRKSPEPTSLD
jgi:hypothetical protein